MESRGERSVKNITRPIEVFSITAEGPEAASTAVLDFGMRGQSSFIPWPPENDRERAPYRGLKPLESVDAGIFFGRAAPIAEAVERLRALRATAATRLLVILGASGAGKSSFLRAGLLPQLARDSRNFLPLPVIRPERSALYGENGLLGAIEAALPTRTRGEIRAAIRGGAVDVRPLLAELGKTRPRGTRARGETARPTALVIAIDQAEELFRVEGAEESAALLGLIRDLTAEDEPTVIAIFAIRSDSYDALQHAKPLEGLPQSALPLLPMPRAAYKDVIEGPARRFVNAGGRLTIDPQLTQRLLADIERGGGSDALPLLAFTLEQLFIEYRRAGALRLAKLRGIRGVERRDRRRRGARVFARRHRRAHSPRAQGARGAAAARAYSLARRYRPGYQESTPQHRAARGYSRGSARADRSARRGEVTHHRTRTTKDPQTGAESLTRHRRAST